MGDTVKDNEFGEMEYRHKWVKKEKMMMLGKERTLTISALAYSGDSICDKQRKAYQSFSSNRDELLKNIPKLISEYAHKHFDEITEHFSEMNDANEALNFVNPSSIVFSRDGKVVIMCNVDWDEENGIGIEILPEYKVDLQDAFL